MNKTKKVLSGIRPTNRLHIGNYLGAVKGMLALQEDPSYETYYMVADLHTLTTPYDVNLLKEQRKAIIIDYLAAGLDPEKSVLFIQSMVPQHTELAYLFSTVITVARMSHLPTYKEKVKQHPDNATMALLNYPVLMASDILIYKAHAVPVGRDQKPHIEVSREIARKMNDIYGMDFPEPDFFGTSGEYVPSLLGEGKMSKSIEGSYINLMDDLATINSRLARVATDSGSGSKIPTDGGVDTLLKLVDLFVGADARKEYENAYLGSGIRYKDLKENLAQAIFDSLRPLQDKRHSIEKDVSYVEDVIQTGASKASKVAQQTLEEVKTKMGLL